jgi:hypothetical protein
METELYARHVAKFMEIERDIDPDKSDIVIRVTAEARAKEAMAKDIESPYVVINSLLGTVLGIVGSEVAAASNNKSSTSEELLSSNQRFRRRRSSTINSSSGGICDSGDVVMATQSNNGQSSSNGSGNSSDNRDMIMENETETKNNNINISSSSNNRNENNENEEIKDQMNYACFVPLSVVTLAAPPLTASKEELEVLVPKSLKWKLTSGGYLINQANNHLVLEVYDVIENTTTTTTASSSSSSSSSSNSSLVVQEKPKKSNRRASARANFKALLSEVGESEDDEAPPPPVHNFKPLSSSPSPPIPPLSSSSSAVSRRSLVRANLKVLITDPICNEDNHQKWMVVNQGEIVNVKTGGVLTIRNGSKKVNTEIWAREPNSTNAQWWFFK